MGVRIDVHVGVYNYVAYVAYVCLGICVGIYHSMCVCFFCVGICLVTRFDICLGICVGICIGICVGIDFGIGNERARRSLLGSDSFMGCRARMSH